MTPAVRPAFAVGWAGDVSEFLSENSLPFLSSFLGQHEPPILLGEVSLVDEALDVSDSNACVNV
jgi:hypothetical protein